MPIYSYICPAHGVFDVVRRIANMQQQEMCPQCTIPCDKVIVVPGLVSGDLTEYDCPITGKRIRGWREHRENLKQHGCRVFEAGEREDFIKNRESRIDQQMDAAADRIIKRTVEYLGGIDLS